MEQPRRLLRAIGVATLLIGLLALAALAAGGRTPLGGDRAEGRAPPMVFWDYVFSTAVVLFVLALPFLVWVFWASHPSERRRSGRRRDITVLVYVALVCATIVALSHVWDGQPEQRRPPDLARGRAAAQQDEGRRALDFRWLPLILVAGAALAAVAYQSARARRAAGLDEHTEDELVDGLASLLDDTLDELRHEPDPRRAVISAYARMERLLSASGVPRLPFEAPLEYAKRVAAELELVPVAPRFVFELTHLYERAKFSEHTIDPEMKEHAIVTLQSLRLELLMPA